MKKSLLAASTALTVVLAAGHTIAATQPEDAAATQAWVDPVTVRLGDSVTGALIEGDSRTTGDGLMDRYVLDLAAGTRVEIVMRSDAFDTFLIAGFLGADGFEQIAVDDDGLGEGLNSRLRFTAAEAGQYEIRSRGFAGLGAGDYTLTFAERAPAQEPSVGSLAVGSSVAGALSADDATLEWAEDYRYDSYRFQAQAGDRLEAIARSDEFDTTLLVTRESRWGAVEQVAFDDDGLGDGTNSRVRFHIQEGGDYTLQVSSYSPDSVGAYQLDLTRREPLPAPIAVVAGAEISGEISSTDAVADDDLPFDAYAFEAAPGQRFEILASSPSFPTAIEVGRMDGSGGWESLAFGDGTMGAQPNSRLIFSPSEGGTYIVRIGASEATMRGDYMLTVRDRGPLPPAPPAGSIGVGDSVAGVLAEADGVSPNEKFFDEYDVRTEAGQRLSITARSDVFDTYLIVYRRQVGGEYEIVAEDDDSGGDLDSRVLLNSEGGDYRIQVTSYSPGETGDYSLVVRDLGQAAMPSPLVFGGSIDGGVTDADALTETEVHYDSYGFNLAEGERAQFVARSDEFDTFLIVTRRDEQGFEYLSYDDDGFGDGTTNSRLTFAAAEAGDYELWVVPLDPATSGTYSLEARLLGPTPPSVPIILGATVNGELRDGDGLAAEATNYDGYTFQGTVGQRVRIDMSSESFDTFLLLGVHGQGGLSAIGENDDVGSGTNSSITMTLPGDALYEVWATSYAVGETGDYALTITDLGPEPGPGSLLIGATIRGALNDQDPVGVTGAFHDAYRFEGELDHTVRITATSNAFDTYLELGRWQDGVFTSLAEDDDGLSDLNSLLTFTFPETGSYVVRVRSYAPGATGDYVLTVEEAPPI